MPSYYNQNLPHFGGPPRAATSPPQTPQFGGPPTATTFNNFDHGQSTMTTNQFSRNPTPSGMHQQQQEFRNFNHQEFGGGNNRYFTNQFAGFSSTSTASSSVATTPSPPPPPPPPHVPSNLYSRFGFDPANLMIGSSTASTIVSNSFQGIGAITWLTNERGVIEELEYQSATPMVTTNVGGGCRSPSTNDDNNNRNRGDEASSGIGGRNSKPTSPMNNQQPPPPNQNPVKIAFEIKDFCDQSVHDLTTVLRVGYLVKFQASLIVSPTTYPQGKIKPVARTVATFVSPLSVGDWTSASGSVEAATHKLADTLDVASIGEHQQQQSSTATSSLMQQQDDRRFRTSTTNNSNSNSSNNFSYDLRLETRAIDILMNIYKEQASNGPECPLTTFHCIVSNCGDQEMYRYIGTSSQKRRQFVENRRHFYFMAPDDTVHLVPSAVFVAVKALSRELLHRGGSMKLQELFNQYSSWPELPLEAREIVGESKSSFMQFLHSHPFVFSMFPSKVFVSLRHRLPEFEYGSFLEECFGDQEGSPHYGMCPPPSMLNAAAAQHQQQQQPMVEQMGPATAARWEEKMMQFGGPNGGNIQGAHHPPSNRQMSSPPNFAQQAPSPAYHQQSHHPPQFGGQSSVPPMGNNGYASFNFPPRGGMPPPPHHAQAPLQPPPSSMMNNHWPHRDDFPTPAAMIGSSQSLSSSSGYSTGAAAPSTPASSAQQHAPPFWSAAVGGGGSVNAIGGGRPSSSTTMRSPENATALGGFWKSGLDFGNTETLLRQMAAFGQLTGGGGVTTPTTAQTMPPLGWPQFGGGLLDISAHLGASGVLPSLDDMATMTGYHNKPSNSTQTDDAIGWTMKCNHCGLDNVWKPTAAAATIVGKSESQTQTDWDQEVNSIVENMENLAKESTRSLGI